MDGRMSFQKHYEVVKDKIEKGLKMLDILKWKKASAWKRTYA